MIKEDEMALRFRKSVKIAKGLKVNFSKSGASLSLGGKGHSVNFSKRGTRATIGVPGTGLSYSAINKTTHSPTPRSNTHPSQSSSIKVIMDDWGNVIFEDENGIEITDKAVIRKLKATPTYQSHVEQLKALKKETIEARIHDAEIENERFINVYSLAPTVDSIDAFESKYSEIQPNRFLQKSYPVNKPTEDAIRQRLQQEADTEVKGFFLTIGKAKKKYVEDNLPLRYAEAVTNWESKKKEFENQQEEKKRLFDKQAIEVCEREKEYLRNLINGAAPVVEEAFDLWIESCEFPVEISIDYDWDSMKRVMFLDIHLPNSDCLKPIKLIKTESGNLKEKKKTQTELRSEYVKLVLGLAIFISANVFNISPAIQRIVASGYAERENKEGMASEDYIYSFKFLRVLFENTDFSTVEPISFCMKAENRINVTSTSILKTIVPFDSFE